MLVNRQIPALWNGISQQPDPVRLPTQCAEQVNFWSSVVDGVRKRGPSEFLAKLPAGAATDGTYMHVIDRDSTERYIVIMDGTRIRVFDLQGREKTVSAPMGWGYLSLPAGVDPRVGYVCMTVADYTFVLNKTKKVELMAVGADLDPPTGDYWWLNRSPAAPLRAIDTDSGGGGGGGGGGGSLPPPPTPTPEPDPDPDSNPPGTYKGEKQTLQDLPASGNANGDVWKIVGNAESDFSSYYVIYQNGAWYESVMPGLKNMIDPLTMPFALVRQPNGTFIFGPFAWAPRHVGDDKSNPHPSFVHRAIRDLFFYRNRLGFTVDENVVMSRAGAFGTFHRLTVVDYLADEVIDIAASETQVTKMEFAVPFSGSMMLFSDQTQFQLSHKEALTGGTLSLDVTTRYPTIPGVRPAPSGSDIYFPSHGSGWGLLREYFVNTDGITNDAADVSAHAPTYVPYGIHTVVAAPEFDAVFLLTNGASNKVFIYKYYWQTETEKAQSAWHHWEFEPLARVLSAKPLGGYLYLMVQHAGFDETYGTGYVSIERIPLFYGGLVGGVSYQIHLDRRWVHPGPGEGVQIVEQDSYAIQLPYDVPLSDRANFRAIAVPTGENLKILSWDANDTFRIKHPPENLVCGFVYESRYVFSKQFHRNGQQEAILTGRLQLKQMSVYYTDTAYFRVEIKPYGPSTQTLKVRQFPSQVGSVIGGGALGSPNFASGKATFGVQANGREAEIALVNDSYLGCSFHSAEWEGKYTK